MRLTQDNLNHTDTVTDRYVIHILRVRQNNACLCGEPLSTGYQLAHKRYGIDIACDDLSLLCGTCHAKEHKIKSCSGTMRR